MENRKLAYTELFVYQGIYRKNTRGRAYLIFRDSVGQRRIVRTTSKFDVANGQTVSVIGAIRNGWLIASRVIPRVAPRRKPGALFAARYPVDRPAA
jgi:hypothetical protein